MESPFEIHTTSNSMNEQKFTDKGEDNNMMKNKTNVKWKKRAATIVMSLCLLMGLMPIKVFAADSSAQLPVYTIEREEGGDYVKRDDLTATFTSSTDFTLGAFQDQYNVYGVKLDYHNPNANLNDYGGLDDSYDILVECNISLQFTNPTGESPTGDSISGEITIPLPSGYDGATAKIKDGDTRISAISSTETTVTFPVTLDVSSYNHTAFTQLYVEYEEKEQHTHSFGDWKKDETNHWRECACGEKADSATHSYDNDADTTCNVCDYVRTVQPQHTHSYGDGQKDKTNHWRECACGEKADSAAHSYDNDADTTCNVCDYVRTVITKGQNEKWTQGSANELIFTSNAPLSEFISVTIDGQVVDEKNYVKEEGSTIIKLKADYLSTLPAGNHTISINSTSGSATTAFTIEETAKASTGATTTTSTGATTAVSTDAKSPKTGDNNNLFLWTTMLCIAGFAIFGTRIYSKKEKNIK